MTKIKKTNKQNTMANFNVSTNNQQELKEKNTKLLNKISKMPVSSQSVINAAYRKPTKETMMVSLSVVSSLHSSLAFSHSRSLVN